MDIGNTYGAIQCKLIENDFERKKGGIIKMNTINKKKSNKSGAHKAKKLDVKDAYIM